MFGRGRFQNGILIQPKEPFDPSDEAKLEDYRNKIWCVCHCILHEQPAADKAVDIGRRLRR